MTLPPPSSSSLEYQLAESPKVKIKGKNSLKTQPELSFLKKKLNKKITSRHENSFGLTESLTLRLEDGIIPTAPTISLSLVLILFYGL